MYIVQFLSFIILSFITLCALYNFKATVLTWVPFHLLFNAQVALRYEPPGLALVVAVNLVLIIIYAIKRNLNRSNLGNQTNKEPYILKKVVLLTIVSYTFSILFATVPVNSGITKMLREFISGFAVIFLFQRTLKNEADFKLFVNACIIVAVLISGLGIYEFVFKDNPVLDFIYYNSPHDVFTKGRMHYIPPQLTGGLEIRYGMVRANSFFGIHISFGVACVMFLFLFGVLMRRKWKFLSQNKCALIILLLLVATITSNSKAPMLGIIILTFSFFRFSQIINFKTLCIAFVGIILLLHFVPDYMKNLFSLFDEELAEEGKGSSVGLRERQMEVAWSMFMTNPLWGNGVGSIDILKKIGNNADILGAESTWLQILPERGLLGAAVYLFHFLILYSTMLKYVPRKEVLFFLASIFTMDSVTGYLDLGLYGCIAVAVRFFYKNKIANRDVINNVSFATK